MKELVSVFFLLIASVNCFSQCDWTRDSYGINPVICISAKESNTDKYPTFCVVKDLIDGDRKILFNGIDRRGVKNKTLILSIGAKNYSVNEYSFVTRKLIAVTDVNSLSQTELIYLLSQSNELKLASEDQEIEYSFDMSCSGEAFSYLDK